MTRAGQRDGMPVGGSTAEPRKAPDARSGSSRLLEVCVDSLDGALAAQAGGARRLELCAELSLGGLTPGPGLLALVRERVALPIVVLVRPRVGGFVYSPSELETLARDVVAVRAAGADGVALGVLTVAGGIDLAATAELLRIATPLPVTFHRAFDLLPDLAQGLEHLAGLGVARVLTSGGRPRVPEALPTLAALVRQAGERLVVMPGGGVRSADLPQILAATGVREVHASARGRRRTAPLPVHGPADVRAAVGGLSDTEARRGTDVDEVAALVAALRAT